MRRGGATGVTAFGPYSPSRLAASTEDVLGTLLDGVARHTPEGYAFQRRAAEAGFRTAVRERDDPFGDAGRSTFKG